MAANQNLTGTLCLQDVPKLQQHQLRELAPAVPPHQYHHAAADLDLALLALHRLRVSLDLLS